ncbi:hypothetical protein [uncultured Kordia sp.]|uniref:hypothetical protein n=1 Tax=uncultured Kordia sp. TaxID=507699 RepID=UPI002609BDE7|nr:hypothetical protein [uncultured Kordia sp.]
MKKYIYPLLISSFLIGAIIIFLLKFNSSKNDTLTDELSKIDTEMQSTWKNKQLVYPDELVPINTEIVFNTSINTKESLIINYLDADCSVCIDDLTLWEKYLKNNQKKAIFIISGSEKIKVDYMINDVLFFKHPVYYDEFDGFNQLNELSNYKAYHSFQVQDNKVIKVGSPVLLENFK